MGHTNGIGDFFARQIEDDGTGINSYYAIGNVLKIACDVAGKQHAASAIAGEIAQAIKNLIARNRVKPRCCLVKNQQVSVVGKRAGELKLHAHTAREVLHLRFWLNVELAQETIKCAGIPLRVGGCNARHCLLYR